MRSPVVIALVAVALLLAGATALLYQKYSTTSASFAKLQTDEQEMRGRYGAAIDEIAAIQDSLNAIALGDSAAGLVASSLDAEQRLSATQGDAALERIAVIRAGIERTKERIQVLDDQLHKNGVRIAGLQKMIAGLRRDVATKEQQVAVLSGQVDSLTTRVTGLEADVEEKQTTIVAQAENLEQKRREIGTVYVAIGSTRDLKESGIVVANGGLLGLGKTLEPTGRLPEGRYTTVDTDVQTVIPIPAAKARVVSDQPVTSYELRPVGERLELHIIDPAEFRKIRHVVIVTA
jgi:archaellum component FlaC